MMNFDTPIAKPSDPGWYGNGVLWTQFPRGGFDFLRGPGGRLTLKMPWFRASRGPVTIDGRPLHGAPARLRARVNAGDYGPYGFVPAGLVFGRPGCWLLRAHLAGHVLVVVLDVRQETARSRASPTAPCGTTALHRGTVPAWTDPAWAESSGPPTRLHHAISARGRAAAFVFGYPLRAGVPTSPANKVLWVIRLAHRAPELTIRATPLHRARPSIVVRRVHRPPAGVISIPTYVNVPSPGCWRMKITSAGYSDSLTLRYLVRRR
jgi:hypothetical protein